MQFDLIDAPACLQPFGPISGLACDWGSQLLYATDGTHIATYNYVWNGSNLAIASVNCCGNAPVLDELGGLAGRPGGATTSGTQCNNGSCANCPMVHRLRNDPVLDNQDFTLAISAPC